MTRRPTLARPRPTGAHRSAAVCIAVLVALTALLVAACGVDVDSAPRPVRTEASTTTTSAAPASGRAEVVLYYVREGVLLPVIDELPDRGLNSTLSALLQPPSDAMVGLGTSIPSGTELLGVEREAGVLRIDLSDAFDNVVGRSRQQAIGQLVLTSTQVSDVRNVSFEVEGEQITVLSPSRGDRTEVNACDFQSLLATVEDASAAALPFASFEVLSERRRELDDECR
ncbi:MAG: GerMN domain-containing protein [Actinomycetota bacterium]|nr:GerMN domain-containing protein [Actinomycetota bacterium]